MGLTKKRRVFVEEYLRCWNGAEAARRAGYKYPRRQASRLLTFVDVQEAIKERIAEKAMSADEVLLRLAEQARGDISEFLTITGAIDWDAVGKKGRLVKTLIHRKGQQSKIELYDAQSALVHIGRHLGLFKDRLQVEGTLELKDADPKGKLLGRLGSIAARESETGGGQQLDG